MLTNRKSFPKTLKSVTRQVDNNARAILVYNTLIDLCGNLSTGMLLSQIVYWSSCTKDPDGWFYKTNAEWLSELRIGQYQLRNGIKRLKEMGLLVTKVKKANGAPTTHYLLLRGKLLKMVQDYGKSAHPETSREIAEITQGLSENRGGRDAETSTTINTNDLTPMTEFKSSNEDLNSRERAENFSTSAQPLKATIPKQSEVDKVPERDDEVSVKSNGDMRTVICPARSDAAHPEGDEPHREGIVCAPGTTSHRVQSNNPLAPKSGEDVLDFPEAQPRKGRTRDELLAMTGQALVRFYDRLEGEAVSDDWSSLSDARIAAALTLFCRQFGIRAPSTASQRRFWVRSMKDVLLECDNNYEEYVHVINKLVAEFKDGRGFTINSPRSVISSIPRLRGRGIEVEELGGMKRLA